MNLVYLHGFASSPASEKAKLIAEGMKGQGGELICPQLPLNPCDAIELVSQQIEQVGGDVGLIGSSLGGAYAAFLAERYGLRAVLINPLVPSCFDPVPFIGNHALPGGQHFAITREMLESLGFLSVTPSAGRYWVLLEKGDKLLNWEHAAEHYKGSRQTILEGGSHSFTRFQEFVPGVIHFLTQ